MLQALRVLCRWCLEHIVTFSSPKSTSKGTLSFDKISQRSELFFFFQKTEEWEKNKTEEDMDEYVWAKSSSESSVLQTLLQMRAAESSVVPSREELLGTKEVEDYQKCVVHLKNGGENEESLAQYKESVKRLLNLA